ncbi:DNA-directed RNA polymerase subunit E'' [Candidatus Bathyarchaeota archaeon]|nr:DNA-directed RNA polymerase subunit E'' [Candidatus Bathyarchaeota archaeon]
MKACRSCKNLSNDQICPVCKSTEFSDDFSGLLIVLDPEHSILAEKLDTTEQGAYALKIR